MINDTVINVSTNQVRVTDLREGDLFLDDSTDNLCRFFSSATYTSQTGKNAGSQYVVVETSAGGRLIYDVHARVKSVVLTK